MQALLKDILLTLQDIVEHILKGMGLILEEGLESLFSYDHLYYLREGL